MPVQALARRAGCSEVTARRRLRRLVDDEIVQIVAAVDPFQIGYEAPAVIGLKVDRRRIEAVAERPAEHPSVRFAAAATGRDDLIVEVVAASNQELGDFLVGYLAEVDGIKDAHASPTYRRAASGSEGRGPRPFGTALRPCSRR
jgi:Lrp/AsnC family transcriptional regulator for asnA, asnC and gidA